MGLTPILRDDLKEIHFGHFEGLTTSEIAARYPESFAAWRRYDDPDFTYPGGESLRSFYGRVSQALKVILAESRGETVAVVSHGGVLGSYLAGLLEDQPLLWPKYVPHNCSITEVRVDEAGATVVCFDDHSALDALEPGPSHDEVGRVLLGQEVA